MNVMVAELPLRVLLANGITIARVVEVAGLARRHQDLHQRRMKDDDVDLQRKTIVAEDDLDRALGEFAADWKVDMWPDSLNPERMRIDIMIGGASPLWIGSQDVRMRDVCMGLHGVGVRGRLLGAIVRNERLGTAADLPATSARMEDDMQVVAVEEAWRLIGYI